MKFPKRYTITAALPYANGPKHIGHLAGAYLPADIYVRLLKNLGKDVVFVCGSDEHGTAIANQAIKENTTPLQIIDKYHALNESSFRALGINFDVFHRTSSPLHHETAQDFFRVLHQKNLLKEHISDQFFDEQAQQFLADRYIKGTCPHCGYLEAFGDQCEKCGTSLSPNELINPKSTLSGSDPVLRPTKHWYLPLNEYESFLRSWILDEHQADWKANVYGQCKSWIDGGLQPRAVTRDLDWGVKVPVANADGKVLYVWFDAPIGYISATKHWANEKEKDWKPYWQDPDTALIHFIGKDNIVFHCIIFPTMLKAHGSFILPQQIPANEFMNLEGDKMSTSRHWSIEMHTFLADFPDKVDVLRYCLVSNMPETKDSEFTWRDFQAKNNNELVAILGNFVNRVMVLMHKYFQGKVPEASTFTSTDLTLFQQINDAPLKIEQAILAYRFREALAEMMQLARIGNKYLADEEPWKTIKTDEARTKTILFVSIQVVAALKIILEPFLPFTAQKISKMLAQDVSDWSKLQFDIKNEPLLAPGLQLGEPNLLFEKIEDQTIEHQLEKLKGHQLSKLQTKQQNIENDKINDLMAEKPVIEFGDFSKIDLRNGLVVAAEKVPKANKLLKLTVDLGYEIRTIVSGIATHFKPEEMIGKQVVVVANLAPKKLKGITSAGMILMAEDHLGNLKLIAPEERINVGASIS